MLYVIRVYTIIHNLWFYATWSIELCTRLEKVTTMNVENLITIVTSMGGGFFVGAIVGYFMKKIIKIIMFVLGGLVAVLFYLQQQ